MAEETGEKAEDDPGGKVKAETKIFYFSPHQEGFSLKEVHRQGEREILFSRNQASWIAKGLDLRSKSFGNTIRREAVVLDGRKVIMIEGSNQKGVFMAIQVVVSDLKKQFIVIPAGKEGKLWQKVSSLIGLGNQVPIQSSTSLRSYASIVRGETEIDKGDSILRALQIRVESLEAEVAELRSRFVGSDEGWRSAENGFCSAATENPSILGKKRASPLDLDSKSTDQIEELPDRVMALDSGREPGLESATRSTKGREEQFGVSIHSIDKGERFEALQIDVLEISELLEPGWIDNHCYEEEISEAIQDALLPFDLVSDIRDSSLGEISSLEDSNTSIVDLVLSTSEDSQSNLQDYGNAVASLKDTAPITAEFWDLEESEDEMATSSSNAPCFTLQEDKEKKHVKERKRWEKSASKLKENLRKKEEALWMEDIPDGFSMGEHIQIDGEIFDGLAIVKMLIPPSSAKRSRLAFHYWSSLVGRPLLRKLRKAGIDIDLDLFGKDHLVSAIKH